jgi:hypothetical protein
MTENIKNILGIPEKKDIEIVSNCAWCNPLGSPGRTALQASLKPNQVISDGICKLCAEKQIAMLDEINIKPQN